MAEYISFQPSDFFNTVLYTGDGVAIGSGGNAITGVGFQPDFTWIKNRDAGDNHILTDAVRGATKYVSSDDADLQYTNTEYLTAFGADGFTVGSGNPVNTNTEDFASWNWKMGTTTGIAGSPSITPSSYSFNTTAGQSVIAYTGNGLASATIPHGLPAAPTCVIIKALESSDSWLFGHDYLNVGTTPWNYSMELDLNSADYAHSGYWTDTAPTSTLVTLGTVGRGNTSGETMIAYCFTDIKGYSKFSSYTGNGNADGPFIYTGFRPALVVTKRTDTIGGWCTYTDKVLGYNPDNDQFLLNDPGAAGVGNNIDLLSNGFKIMVTTAESNASGGDFIYMAFAESPIVSSNDVPTVAR